MEHMYAMSNQENPLTAMVKVEQDVLDSLGVSPSRRSSNDENNVDRFSGHRNQDANQSYNNHDVLNSWDNRQNISPQPDHLATRVFQAFLKTVLEQHMQKNNEENQYRIERLRENDIEVSMVSSSYTPPRSTIDDEPDHVSLLELRRDEPATMLECTPEINVMDNEGDEYVSEGSSSGDYSSSMDHEGDDMFSSIPSLSENPYVCHKCNLRFSERADLIEHKKVHRKQKREHQYVYPADTFTPKMESNYSPKQESTYPLYPQQQSEYVPKSTTPKKEKPSYKPIKRETTQGGPKEYVCDQCSKSYSTMGNLNQHKMIHTGDKPFACPKCDIRFTRKFSLKSHIQNVHK